MFLPNHFLLDFCDEILERTQQSVKMDFAINVTTSDSIFSGFYIQIWIK
jgi:hypothetical protein